MKFRIRWDVVILGIVALFALSITVQAQECVFGWKDEDADPSSSWSAPEGTLVCRVVVKAGNTARDVSFYSDGCISGYCCVAWIFSCSDLRRIQNAAENTH